MPDTDFEACPVGTMALLEQIADDLDGVTADPDVKSLCRLAVSHRDMVRAILKAHRERMGRETPQTKGEG